MLNAYTPLLLQPHNDLFLQRPTKRNRAWLAVSRFDVVGLFLGKLEPPHNEASAGLGVRIEKFPEGFHERVRWPCYIILCSSDGPLYKEAHVYGEKKIRAA